MHSGFPCVSLEVKNVVPKKVSKSLDFSIHLIFIHFWGFAPVYSYLGPFLQFLLIFMDFYFMFSLVFNHPKPYEACLGR